jgi:hypothetical protein
MLGAAVPQLSFAGSRVKASIARNSDENTSTNSPYSQKLMLASIKVPAGFSQHVLVRGGCDGDGRR